MNTLSYPELAGWLAYFSIYPFSEDREDIRAGVIASTIANANRGKGQKAYQPKDFIVKYGQAKEKQSWESIYANAMLWSSVLGKKQQRGNYDS